MGITFQKALGIHPNALALRLARTEILAANIANADTPNFKAKDIDFAKEMQHANFSGQQSLSASPELLYRTPFQASQDGNSVELNVEQSEFTKNNLDFQTSLMFLNMKFSGLQKAIEGK